MGFGIKKMYQAYDKKEKKKNITSKSGTHQKIWKKKKDERKRQILVAQSAETVEYTDCLSAEG